MICSHLLLCFVVSNYAELHFVLAALNWCLVVGKGQDMDTHILLYVDYLYFFIFVILRRNTWWDCAVSNEVWKYYSNWVLCHQNNDPYGNTVEICLLLGCLMCLYLASSLVHMSAKDTSPFTAVHCFASLQSRILTSYEYVEITSVRLWPNITLR